MRYPELNQSVFLWVNTLSLRSIMIGADLVVFRREDRRPFSERNSALVLEDIELPLNKGIVVGVDLSCNEGPSPVNMNSKSLKVVSAYRREILQPNEGVLELGNFAIGDTHLSHDDILSTFKVIAEVFSLTDFGFNSICCGIDRHSRAMESERPKDIIALESIV
jgi:hypothetical protein